ncbi:MAG: hypothetical protein DDT25_00247 [Chloroflexi bacterium]|nr:hypothetical protein [Chloroflexota bacterium]
MNSEETTSGLNFDLYNLRYRSKVPLYKKDAHEFELRPAFVFLTKDGNVTADYFDEGDLLDTLRFSVPEDVCGNSLADFLESPEGRGLLERIKAGCQIEWDGNNHVQILTADAKIAKEKLCNFFMKLHRLQIWGAKEYFFDYSEISNLWYEGETLAQASARNFADVENYINYINGGEDAAYKAFLEEAVRCIEHPNYTKQITPAQAAHLYEIGAVDLDSYNEWREVNDGIETKKNQ